jgi:hypothetical protein
MSIENFRKRRDVAPVAVTTGRDPRIMRENVKAIIRDVMVAMEFEATLGNFKLLDQFIDWNLTHDSLKNPKKMYMCRIRKANVGCLPVVVDEDRLNPEFYEVIGEI